MRHIPSCDTAHAGVLSFENALKPTCADFDRSRWLYVPDHYSEYRYLLGTKGQRPLVCIGINPSTAVPDRLDNTLKSAERIALHMEPVMNPVLHQENMKAFSWLLSSLSSPPDLWAAWGAVIEKRPYLPVCVLDMASIGEAFGARWFTAGPRSKAGHPHHPLYLKKDTVLDPFTDLKDYLLLLSGRKGISYGQHV